MESAVAEDRCAALIAPGLRCEHLVEDHELHGSTLLECCRCEDWRPFVLAATDAPESLAA